MFWLRNKKKSYQLLTLSLKMKQFYENNFLIFSSTKHVLCSLKHFLLLVLFIGINLSNICYLALISKTLLNYVLIMILNYQYVLQQLPDWIHFFMKVIILHEKNCAAAH